MPDKSFKPDTVEDKREVKFLMPEKSFQATVWKTLRAVDVTALVEKKANMSYISWANAWILLMDTYPESTHYIMERVTESNGTVAVRCLITIKDGDNEVSREMSLPVMNHKNQAITDPTSRDLNDANQRCLVKCLALHGLGLDLYRKELGVSDTVVPDPVDMMTDEQEVLIREYQDAGVLPEATAKYLAKREWEITKATAEKIINKMKELEYGAG